IPCSTSNLGPGFDTLGLALNRYLFLDVTLSEAKSPAKITVEGNGKEHIADDESNLVICAMKAAAKLLKKELPPFHLQMKNEIPAYGGLGGSGAAIAGGIFLANELLKGNLSREEMLNIAVEIEGHPDNVSAALFGGLTINCYNGNGKVHCRSVKIVKPLSVVTCSPHFQVQTKQARKILPQQIPLKDAVTNIENAASLVAALMSGDFDTLRYVTADRLHEQYRAPLIPGYDEVKKAVLEAGALSFNISGAGPTVFAFAVKNEKEIADSMVKAFEKNNQKATAEVMSVENDGIEKI
ncbi:MAG: homoserine kinase, partial [Bacteroidota bacterium]